MPEWYQLPVAEVIHRSASHAESGLDPAEAANRLEKYGPNELVERGGINPWKILLEQLTEVMVIILMIAAVLSAFLGDLKDAVAILAIVILNAFLGFRQEYQAEKAMAALKKLAVPTVRVRRGGHVQEISARELVPGDVVLLEAGNLVPADGRVLESINLRVQEAALTGESEPVSKESEEMTEGEIPLAERRNMVYMGTVVSYGRGHAMVTATGMKTQLGSIAELMQSAGQESTPLQKRLSQLGKGLAIAAFALVGVVFVLGLLRGEDPKELFLTSISIAVAAVPEGLPAVVTIALALGARRMLNRKALIRKLPAVETLGSVTVICSDKTGTLTENRMSVTVLDIAGHRIDLTEENQRENLFWHSSPCQVTEPSKQQTNILCESPALALLLAGGALCNDAILECEEEDPERYHVVGDPTEGALVIAAARMGLAKETLETILPRLAEQPFDSERKRMSTIHRVPPGKEGLPEALSGIWGWSGWQGDFPYLVITKGAMDGLLEISNQVWSDDRAEPLSPGWRRRIEEANTRLAQSGMRVLGVAVRPLETLPGSQENLEEDLIFIGLVGMIDPARPEVKDAVRICQQAGIRPIMITGDHPLTARYIAQELGISQSGKVLTGQDLDRLSDQELEAAAPEVSVYARVSPEHKLKIVQALQDRGQIAAMTGDGVNDAPALRKADIGVAMGITGTDVSKEAADMVLLDDNFATIVAAVEEGRVIYDNIRKFVKYVISSNAAEIWVMLFAPFLGMPLALLPLQILWINLVTDGLPGLALSFEPPERNTMQRPPYPPGESIFARGVGRDIIWVGVLMGILSLLVGFWYWRMGNPAWQTMVFTTLVFSEMGFVMAVRSGRESLFSIGLFSNRTLLGAVVLTILLQLVVVYIPIFQDLFRTQPLPLVDLGIAFGLSLVLFAAVELQKGIIRWFSR